MVGRRTEPRKTIFDPIHGVISVRGAALSLIGLPPFQRLWGIRQTGFAHLVFPGANHTRLEHSLGVFSVAGAMAEQLDLPEDAARRVTLGGLLHDLGHGPFSHTLEPTMREVLGHGHERASRAWILGERRSDDPPGESAPSIPDLLESEDVDPKAVADLVDPPPGPVRSPLERAVLHGAIDSDRIDYLQRDAHYTGVAHGAIDAVRLLHTARVHRGRLVFEEKGRSAVEGFLVGRALMYSSVYYHKTVRAAEVMAQAAVERLPGFPAVAAPLLDQNDGELLVALETAGGLPQRLARRITTRRLYKMAQGWRELAPEQERRFRRWAIRPVERRAAEDALAGQMGAEPGTVLLDLSGLDARAAPQSDWSEVGLLEDGEVTHPFRGPGLFRMLAGRPPTRWSASVYVAPKMLAVARRAFASGRLDVA